MKLYLPALIACLGLFSACDKDNENSDTPNGTVTKAFDNKYPHASQVKWEDKRGYSVADFWNDQLETTAWFDRNGQWYMTKTEYDRLEQIPSEEVRNAFTTGEYKDWRIEDIDYIERLDAENVYVIEVEQGEAEYDLHYAADGILLKAIPDDGDDDYEDYLPETAPSDVIKAFITDKYPEARIVEIDQEDGFIEVEIIDNKRGKEVVFNKQNEWVNTHYDVNRKEVEEIVMQTLNASYAGYEIDDIEKYETPTGDYYLFELEKGDRETQVKINGEGEIVQA